MRLYCLHSITTLTRGYHWFEDKSYLSPLTRTGGALRDSYLQQTIVSPGERSKVSQSCTTNVLKEIIFFCEFSLFFCVEIVEFKSLQNYV